MASLCPLSGASRKLFRAPPSSSCRPCSLLTCEQSPGQVAGKPGRLTASLTQESQCPVAPFHCAASAAVVLEASGGLWVIIYRSGGGEIRLPRLAVCMSLMVIKRWHCMATLPTGPPFLTIFYCPLLSLPPHASPCADPQDHNPLQLLLDFFFL